MNRNFSTDIWISIILSQSVFLLSISKSMFVVYYTFSWFRWNWLATSQDNGLIYSLLHIFIYNTGNTACFCHQRLWSVRNSHSCAMVRQRALSFYYWSYVLHASLQSFQCRMGRDRSPQVEAKFAGKWKAACTLSFKQCHPTRKQIFNDSIGRLNHYVARNGWTRTQNCVYKYSFNIEEDFKIKNGDWLRGVRNLARSKALKMPPIPIQVLGFSLRFVWLDCFGWANFLWLAQVP